MVLSIRGRAARDGAAATFSGLPIQALWLSDPMPLGVLIVVQVPAFTIFQALPWQSTLEVPAQLVPAPALQSFFPALATP